jgi:two-component system phosphate regulon response regulator PhoB
MSRSHASRRPLVVIVDDEVDITTFLRLALEENGFRVMTFTDADVVMTSLRQTEPDLICLDLLMPRHTGLSLYAEIVRDPRLSTCPVLIMSGLAVRTDFPDMLQRAGGLRPPAGLIDKPIDIDAFLKKVNAVLGRIVGEAP